MLNSNRYAIGFLALSALACSRKVADNADPTPTPGSASAKLSAQLNAAAPSASAAPSAESTSIPDAKPVCKVESKKVWLSGANKLTGLTEATLPDGRIAIGFAVGNQPQVLLLAADAKGAVAKVPMGKNPRLASVPKDATRYMLRVTPAKAEGDNIKAFVDFEDHYKDKRRAIVCGPTDSNDNWVEFEGTPFEARKDAKPAEIAALFHQQGAEKTYDEVHTCRSFTNLDRGQTWVLGSTLHGVIQPDNSIRWRSDFVVTTGQKDPKKIIESTAIDNKTFEDEYYEVPVSHALKNDMTIVAVRHKNHLKVGLLGADKSLVDKLASYPGFPTLPDIAPDGGDALVLSTAFAKAKGEYGLRAMRIALAKPELPKTLQTIVTDKSGSEATSESDPDFIRDAQGQRWLAHIEGHRGDGKLSLAPLGKDFRAIGRSFSVTEDGEKANCARLIPLKDKGILVVFLREADKTLELVSEEIHCKVEQ